MYLDAKIKIPQNISGLTTKTIKGTTYIYYTFSRMYNAEKKYSTPSGTSVGKCVPDEPGMMYPNQNFLRFFPEIDLPEDRDETYRSGCLRIGAYAVLCKHKLVGSKRRACGKTRPQRGNRAFIHHVVHGRLSSSAA